MAKRKMQPESVVTSDAESIGERLTSERVRLEWKTEDLAQKLKDDFQTLRKYEQGVIDIPATFLLKLSKLGFDIQFIVTNVRSPVPDNSQNQTTIQGNNNIQIGNGNGVTFNVDNG